jgi:dihydroneopterin triphosphate diphosphatase
MQKRIQVLCVVFRGNKILLLKRKKSLGGFWQPVCGKMERFDASATEAVLRECREEIGLEIEQIKELYENVYSYEINKHYLTNKRMPKRTEFVFGAEVVKQFRLDISNNYDKEHTEFKWVSFNTALKMLKWDENKTAVKKVWFKKYQKY